MNAGFNPVHGTDTTGGRTIMPTVSYYVAGTGAAFPGVFVGTMRPGIQNLAVQPDGAGNPFARFSPQNVEPFFDENMPAAHMINSTGGVGCEPGYNYFFAAEHTKIHVVKGSTPPWQAPDGSLLPFMGSHVPTNTRIGELFRGFGCNDPDPKMNICHEVVPGDNGRWYRGVSLSEDNRDAIRQTLKEVGWDSSRTGRPGEKPAVYLWFSK